MKLIDANVILYSLGTEHPYKEACDLILNSVSRNTEEYALDAEVLQEVMYVLGRLGSRDEAIIRTRDLLDAFNLIIPIGADEIRAAVHFYERYPVLSARDAIHAAVVITHRLEGIVSTDKGFDVAPEINRYDPISLAGA